MCLSGVLISGDAKNECDPLISEVWPRSLGVQAELRAGADLLIAVGQDMLIAISVWPGQI
jgi:hypothetical protein